MTFKVNTIPPKRLAATIDGTASTFQLNDILGFDEVALSQSIVGDTLYGSFQDTTGTYLELFKVDTSTIASASITMTKRGLQFNEDGTETEVSGNKRLWIKNQTIVNLGTNVPALFRSFMDKVSAETVAGVKTFSSSPIVPTPTTDYQASTKKYVDDIDAATDAVVATKVSLTGDQTVDGVKTFSSSPVVPTGGTGTQAANATDIANAITGASGTATNTTNGTLKLSVAAASAPDPIAVGDNDGRVPTQDENDAMAGTGTPSSTNKFITEDTPFIGGDGSDGPATISSGTTTLTKDMYYTNLTVNGTGTLNSAGYRIYVSGTLTVDNTSGGGIINPGGAGGNASGATAGAAGAAPATGTLPGGVVGVIGVVGNSIGGSSSQSGNNGTTGTSAALGLGTAGTTGGNGGVGGATAGTGGAGGSITGTITQQPRSYTWANNLFQFSSSTATAVERYKTSASGGSGGSGGCSTSGGQTATSGGGGGSGGSGGFIFIEARKAVLTGAGCINAKGGNGGNGGNGAGTAGGTAGGGGGGAGGSGGVVIFIYQTKTGTGTVLASGGAGGTAGTSTAGTAATNGSTGNSGTVITIS